MSDRHSAPSDYGFDMGFGIAMKAARNARGWTQVQLAEFADVNAETIHRIERGMNTRISTMEKIRKVLPDLSAGNNGQLTAQQIELQQRAAADEQRKTDTEALREQVIHLIRAVADLDHLQRIRSFALRQLTATEATASHHSSKPSTSTKKTKRATR